MSSASNAPHNRGVFLWCYTGTFFGNLNDAWARQASQTKLCCIRLGSFGNGSTILIFMTPPHSGHAVVASVFAGEAITAYRDEAFRHKRGLS